MSALWAIYVPGPDEYHAMPSREAAEIAARQHNRAVMGQVGRYGRRAERVRDVITQYQSDTAAAALSRLGDGSAQ